MFKYCLSQFVKQTIKNPNKSQAYAFSITKSTSANVDALLPQSLETNKQATGKNPLQNYTKEQQDKILTIVNKNEELLNYDIAKTRAVKLIAWKKRNGPLQSLEDILQIEGFSLRIADKFYKSMLGGHVDEGSKVAPSARRRTAGFITPAIDAEHRAVLRSCVALRVGVSSITWARLELPDSESINAPCNLTHWQHHDITEKKLHLGDLVQRLLYVDHLIPDADCYIFENPQTAINSNPGNVDQQNISIQKSQVTAVLAYALCTRGRYAEALKNGHAILPDANKKTEETWSNVFYLRRFLTARLFSQLVGTERVSSEETILQLMRTHYNVSQLILDDESETVGNDKENDVSFRRNVQFPLAHRDMFSRAERYQREFLGQALLLNLAFMRLVVLQDADSIAVVTRNPNKTELEQLS